MNKNNVIGWILIAAIMVGYMFYQSKQIEKQQAYQAQLDSIAQAESLAQWKLDSAWAAEHPVDTVSTAQASQAGAPRQAAVYRDSLLEASSKAEGQLLTLSNGKLVLTINTKGAQPWSALLPEYTNYGGSDLYLFKEGDSELNFSVFTNQNISTKDFVFEVASQTDSSAVLRLPLAAGGYIQQEYTLHPDSYMVDHALSFVGMDEVIPRNVSVFDMDWHVTVPRMEKGYKNESTYSKLDYYFSGEKKPVEIGRGRNASKRIDNRLSWFAFQQQFFSVIMRSKEEFASGEVSIGFIPQDDPSQKLMTCAASMRSDLRHGPDVRYENEIYLGPNQFYTLKSFGQKYEKIIPLGGWLVGWFTRFVIIPLFNWLHKGIANFGIIILLMTIFIKIVVFPFAYKSYSSSAKMQALKPELDKLNAKYPNQEDAVKKQQATMDLYKRAGISPMGGCLPMLLQFPILWAMFRFFPASIELRQQSFLWADDLSAYDSILNFGFNIPLLGDHLSLFALLMAVSMFFYSKVTMQGQSTGDDPNAKMMRFMSVWMMPIMMFFICNNLSSGLSYYYLLSNLITMIETFVIKKWFVHPEEIRARLAATAGKPVQKSKWEQRLEEAQKMQRQMEKERQKKQRR